MQEAARNGSLFCMSVFQIVAKGKKLNGDTYYKTLYPEHNLVRTRNQLRFFQEVEARRESGALCPDRHY